MPAADEPEAAGGAWVTRRIAIADPAAGATWSLPVPGEYEWRLLAVNALFATSLAGIERVPYLRLRDATREIVRVPLGATVAKSVSTYVQWARGLGELLGGSAAGMVLAPLPTLPLEPGLTLDWLCTNLDAGDRISDITVTVLERFTGPPRELPRRRLGLVEPLDLAARIET